MKRVLFYSVKYQRIERSSSIMFFILLIASIAFSTVTLILYRRFVVSSPKSPVNDENKKIINENDDDKQLTETKIQNVDGENEKQELTSAAEQTFSLFDAVSDDFKFNIFPRNSLTIRTSDTPVQKSVYSCCYSSSTVSKALVGEKNNKNLSIASSLVLMRHFERIDHVDPAWLQKMTSSTSSGKNSSSSSQHCYFHRDPPLSPNGILDGLRFSAQFAARLGKKNRSIEDNFSFIVSSPSLRCLQTALLMAQQQHGVPVLIEDSVSDWVNRRVFGANVSERPQTSMQFDAKTGVWWISEEIISHFVKKQIWSHMKEKVCDDDDDDAAVEDFLPPGVLHDKEKKRFGFFDFQRTLRGANTEDVEQQSRTFFKKLPEPEREFSERVKASIEDILSPSLSFSSSLKSLSSKKQKSFSACQMKKAFFSCTSSRRSTSFDHQYYSLRLLVVTHADFARVAASELARRCANTPSAKDGISVLYGSLSQIVKLVVSKNDDDDDENDSSCCCYHLVSFGSRDPAAADCPIMKVK